MDYSARIEKKHLEFTKQLTFENLEILKKKRVHQSKNFNKKTREEALWLHFISIIEFLEKEDQSPSFRKNRFVHRKKPWYRFEFINNEPLKK